MEFALKILSGVCWTCVYAAAIRVGLRDRTYALPVFALGLNLAWELLYFAGGVVRWSDFTPDAHAQTIINGLWFVLDVGIAVTFVRFGRGQWPGLTRAGFAGLTALVLLISAGAQIGFLAEFGAEQGARYSAFAQNLLMSVLFIVMLERRRSTAGQSMFIAVNKLVGTLAPTISSGFIGEFRPFVAVTGILCLITDLIYVAFLEAVRRPDGALGVLLRTLVVTRPQEVATPTAGVGRR